MQENLQTFEMSGSITGAEGSWGKVALSEQLPDFLELRNALQNSQRVTERRFEAIEARLSQEQDRIRKLEESVRRALVDIMPKVEELLARHLSPQPSREAALRHVAAAGTSAAPRDGRSPTAPANVSLSTGYSSWNPQLRLDVAESESLPSSCFTSSSKATDASATDEESLRKVSPALSATGSWSSALEPSAPPPSEASAATNPPASLHEAAERGDAAAVQRCLDNGAEVDARDKNGNTALHIAAGNGHSKVVDILIANGTDVNKCVYRLRSPLHCAAAEGHGTIVARLVTAGAKVGFRDADGATPAALAAQGGHAEVVLWLLDQGTPVEATDNESKTLLMYAVEGGNLQLVTYLLGKGANPNAVNKKGETPIFTAVKMQRREIVKHFLQNGVSPFKAVKNNESPLMLCSKKGYGDVVAKMLPVAAAGDTDLLKRCLCVAGSADVVWSFVDEARDLVLGPAGGEALVEATRDGRLQVMEALLRVGVDAKASRGEEALREAAKKGHRGCIVALLDAGVNVNARSSFSNRTALHYAAFYGHTECVKELLQRGAKKEQLTEDVLVNVAGMGHLDVLKVLLGLRVNRNVSFEEALRAAAKKGYKSCVAALLDAGVDVNARHSDSKYTALHLAAKNGHVDCVKELLQRGAKKDLKDFNGYTARKLAKKNKMQACTDLLEP